MTTSAKNAGPVNNGRVNNGPASDGRVTKAPERPQFAPPPRRGPGGGGPFGGGMGMPAEKSLNFGPSAKRLLRRMNPERIGLFFVILLGVISVTLSVLGPEDSRQRHQHHLRRRHRQAVAGRHHAGAGRGVRPGAGQRHVRQPAVRHDGGARTGHRLRRAGHGADAGCWCCMCSPRFSPTCRATCSTASCSAPS